MNEDAINCADDHKNFELSEWLKELDFDKDKNDFPTLTDKNVALINFIIKHDSNYRPLNDTEDDSISKTIKEHGETSDYGKILTIVKVIDKSNSTRQASLGKGHRIEDTKEKKDGRELTAEYISGMEDFYERLGRGDIKLVNDIATHSIEHKDPLTGQVVALRYTLSFASKYCTYMARALYENDKEKRDYYSIFDKVICDILPYYAWFYLGNNEYTRLSISKSKKDQNTEKESHSNQKIVSKIREVFGTKGSKKGYSGYCKLIDEIRNKSKELSGKSDPISRKDFDHLLWYYFKGNDKEISRALSLVYKDKQNSEI